jgi:hypothetical protein
MSRVLRRPMFRGGIANSEGTGITSGLDNSRQGYADGPTIEGVQPDVFQRIYKALNPPTSDILKRLQERQKEKPLMDRISDYVLKPVSAADLTYGSEEEKQAAIAAEEEAKKEKLPPAPISPPSVKEEEVSKKQDFKTIYEDLLPIFKASVGPDQDEYTRQKYLELAKFGLNLLKPTPAGVPSSLLSSVASAAEKPLEGYGNIIERERQAAKVPEALALQQAMKLSEPGTVGKAIRDLVQTGAAKNEKEALRIYLKGDSAAQRKETREEKALLASRLQGYEALKGVKDQAVIDQLSELVYEDPSLISKLKGERSKYKPGAYEEGAIYLDKGKIVKYKKGLFYTPSEPGFKG